VEKISRVGQIGKSKESACPFLVFAITRNKNSLTQVVKITVTENHCYSWCAHKGRKFTMLKKIIGVSAVTLALLGAGTTVQAFTHYSTESHGSLGWTGAYEQYWNNYSGHSAQVVAKNGPSSYSYAGTNRTAYASVRTSFGQYVWFYHWDN
jgi:hypothetical protein